MSEISATGSSNIISDLSIKNKTKDEVAAQKELGQDDFMELMTAQMQNQDPLAPMEKGDFIAQLAQFGTVEGIGDLQASFDQFAAMMGTSDATDAASLVGKSVLSEGESARFSEEFGLSGAVDVPEGVTNMQVRIESTGGALMDTIEIDRQPEGLASFKWDGKLADGTTASAGNYVIRATGTGVDGPQSLQTYVGSRVDSVSMAGENGIVLNLAGLGAKPLSEVSRLGL